MLFKNILSYFKKDQTPYLIYSKIVAAARQEDFYTQYDVPDTLEGRFEMISLHASLFFCRLKTEHEDDRRLGQDVFDVMFKDLDRNLREMGVGDLSVGKRIKKLASAFYSRLEEYDRGLALKTDRELLNLLKQHNISKTVKGRKKLVSYIRKSSSLMAKQTMSDFIQGKISYINI